MPNKITATELAKRIDSGEKLQIVDVRTPAEFAACHIIGARNVPLNTIGSSIPGVDPGIPLVVVCQGGIRSAQACQKIAASHGDIWDLAGGTNAWCSSALPTE